MEQTIALVLGLGVSGQSAISFLLKKDYQVIAVDDFIDENDFQKISHLFADAPVSICRSIPEDRISECAFIVSSPGISPSHPLLMLAHEKKIEVIGEMELAMRYLTNKMCIGITGTNGKTTVTLLIEHILNSCNLKAVAVGNIGLPITTAILDDTIDIFVIELSSFQLETFQTKCLDIALVLNITPDHLDRYSSMEEYASTKLSIFNFLKEKGIGYLHESICISPSFRYYTYGFSEKCDVFYKNENIYIKKEYWGHDKRLKKFNQNHDLENILSAICVCTNFKIPSTKILDSIEKFKKPSHRIEFVRDLNGVVYYNDSKGTNIDAVIRAVETMDRKVILICGGVDKGSSYSVWVNFLLKKVKLVYAIGQAAEKIKNELKDCFSVSVLSTLEEAVTCAFLSSEEGDCVLLSPGCSSYDMFKNYEHRGNEFIRLVNSLPIKEKV